MNKEKIITTLKNNMFFTILVSICLTFYLLHLTLSFMHDRKINSYETWDSFVSYHNIKNNENWKVLDIFKEDYLPTEFYPITSPKYIRIASSNVSNIDSLMTITTAENLFISNNFIKDVDGLSNLYSVSGSLFINDNKIVNVKGLDKLERVGFDLTLSSNLIKDINHLNNLKFIGNNLYLDNNALENLNGLDNLDYIGDSLLLNNNLLKNIYGLRNTKVVGNIQIDSDYNGDKLEADTIFCLQTKSGQFVPGYAQRNQVCKTDS